MGTGPGKCCNGHRLRLVQAMAGTCDGCLQLVQDGQWVMECQKCVWYLCLGCQQQQVAQFSDREQLEEMLQELFRLHDLNGNGVLEEDELVQLNSKVAMLHHGKEADLVATKEKFRKLFREKLDPRGRPVSFFTFYQYVKQVLDGSDRSLPAQEMILEQFVAEARSARAVFHVPEFAESEDGAFLSKLSLHSFFGDSGKPESVKVARHGSPAAVEGPLTTQMCRASSWTPSPQLSHTPHQLSNSHASTWLPQPPQGQRWTWPHQPSHLQQQRLAAHGAASRQRPSPGAAKTASPMLTPTRAASPVPRSAVQVAGPMHASATRAASPVPTSAAKVAVQVPVSAATAAGRMSAHRPPTYAKGRFGGA